MQVKSFTKFSAKSIGFSLLGASASVSPSTPTLLSKNECPDRLFKDLDVAS
jgi:hypothetical protein